MNTGNVLTSNGPANYAWGTPRPTFAPIGYTPTGTYVNYGLLGKWAERAAWFHNDDGSVYAPKFNTTDIENSEARPQVTNQWGVSGQFDYKVLGHTLTYLGAYRYQDFDIKNGGQNGRWYIGNSGQQLFNNQTSHELRLASTPADDKLLDYQAGLYYLSARVYSDDPTYYGPDAGAWNASTAQYTDLIGSASVAPLLQQSQNGIYRSQVTDAEVWSRAAFGQIDWHFSSKLKLTTGYRITHETKKNRIRQELDRGVVDGTDLVEIFNRLQGSNIATNGNGVAVSGGNARLLADALALRATAIGGGTVTGAGATAKIAPTRLYDFKYATPITGNLTAWTFSPSYDISKDVSVYASAAQGAKSGYISFSGAGDATQIKPERSRDYEVGIKSLLPPSQAAAECQRLQDRGEQLPGVMAASQSARPRQPRCRHQWRGQCGAHRREGLRGAGDLAVDPRAHGEREQLVQPREVPDRLAGGAAGADRCRAGHAAVRQRQRPAALQRAQDRHCLRAPRITTRSARSTAASASPIAMWARSIRRTTTPTTPSVPATASPTWWWVSVVARTIRGNCRRASATCSTRTTAATAPGERPVRPRRRRARRVISSWFSGPGFELDRE